MALKTVKEFNIEVRAAREKADREKRLTGVACPFCEHELLWNRKGFGTEPWKTTAFASCEKCSEQVELEVL